ncbi:hypothetical protein O6H91_22G024600 [Diphasiastrum complanatum]|uniref:Uncharacterized protein n=2 Tax=Diphasiastrum complanatum TaxID=34168 RepID=A0ACC2ADT8_DIPCM|nr:hypothetical protein O6H91_22G024600 [Diphasiastrum complanatum]KAJ7515714.1 hypothetical protein O6H91_22G024600 [Diphasiastrum complanatum]
MSMIDKELERWGLHLLDGGGNTYDTGSSKGTGDGAVSSVHVTTCSMSGQESIPTQVWLSEGENFFDVSYPGEKQLPSSSNTEDIHASYQNRDLQKETETVTSGDSTPGTSLFDSVRMDRTDSGRKGESSSPDYSYYEDDGNDGVIALVLSEDFSQQDGEVRKRLTHMDSIPHVPKINGEIPTADDATLDHQRLWERLELYGLRERKIPGDGNCQFRALSDQLYRTSEHHKFVRKQIVRQLKSHPDSYEGYVPTKYSDYLKRMAKSGEWGDHVTLQAAADSYGVKICLVTSFKDTCFIEIVAKDPKSSRVIFLSFWSEVHYNSIHLEGDAGIYFEPKKKKHWLLF